MGFWGGFIQAAGEQAHQQNLLDIQQEMDKRKQFQDFLYQRLSDPNVRDEVKPQIQQLLQKSISTKPGQKHDYDISSLFPPARTAPAAGQQITYPGPPIEEGGPPNLAASFQAPARPIAGEAGIAMPTTPYKSFQEQTMEAAQMAGAKAGATAEATFPYTMAGIQARYGGMTSGSSFNGSETDLAQLAQEGYTLEDGRPLPTTPGNYKIEFMRAPYKVRVGPQQEISGEKGPTGYNPASGKWEPMVFDPKSRTYSFAPMPAGAEVAAPGLRHFFATDGQGNWYTVQFDARNQQVGPAQRVAAPASMTGWTRSHEQIIDDGKNKFPVTLYSTSTPGQQTPSLSPGGGSLAPPIPSPPAAGVTQRTGTTRKLSPNISITTPTPQPAPAPAAATAATATGKPATATPAQLAAHYNPATAPPEQVAKQDFLQPDFTPTDTLKEDKQTGTLSRLDTTYNGARPRFILHKQMRPMTPTEYKKNLDDVELYDRTAELVTNMLNNIGMLNNVITAGKIQIATDPSVAHQLVSRVIGKLTPEEQKFAADYQSLMEHINRLRTPLGAAGFRSLEAFMTLQAQKGNLLAQPQITENVLKNSLKALLSLRSNNQYMMNRNDNLPNTATDDIIQEYMIAYGPQKAVTMMRRNRYVD